MQFRAPEEYRIPELFEPLPGQGRRLLGLTRQDLEGLEEMGVVRITEVGVPGRKRPLRVVYVPSLIGHLDHLDDIARIQREAGWRAGYAHHHKPEDLLEVVTGEEERK
jgi:hypothetical protein